MPYQLSYFSRYFKSSAKSNNNNKINSNYITTNKNMYDRENDYNYTTDSNNVKVSMYSSNRKGCDAKNIWNSDNKSIWLSENKVPQYIILDLTHMIKKPKFSFKYFGIYLWHAYQTNPKEVEIYFSSDNRRYTFIGNYSLDLRPGIQIFEINKTRKNDWINYVKIWIKQSYGGDRTYMNQFFLFESLVGLEGKDRAIKRDCSNSNVNNSSRRMSENGNYRSKKEELCISNVSNINNTGKNNSPPFNASSIVTTPSNQKNQAKSLKIFKSKPVLPDNIKYKNKMISTQINLTQLNKKTKAVNSCGKASEWSYTNGNFNQRSTSTLNSVAEKTTQQAELEFHWNDLETYLNTWSVEYGMNHFKNYYSHMGSSYAFPGSTKNMNRSYIKGDFNYIDYNKTTAECTASNIPIDINNKFESLESKLTTLQNDILEIKGNVKDIHSRFTEVDQEENQNQNDNNNEIENEDSMENHRENDEDNQNNETQSQERLNTQISLLNAWDDNLNKKFEELSGNIEQQIMSNVIQPSIAKFDHKMKKQIYNMRNQINKIIKKSCTNSQYCTSGENQISNKSISETVNSNYIDKCKEIQKVSDSWYNKWCQKERILNEKANYLKENSEC